MSITLSVHAVPTGGGSQQRPGTLQGRSAVH